MGSSVKKESNFRMPFIISLLLHAGLLVALLSMAPETSYRWHSQSSQPVAKPIMHAAVVDSTKVDEQIKQIRWEQGAKERQEQEHLKKIEQRALVVAKQRVAEQQKLQELQKKQIEARKQQQALEKASQARVQHLKQRAKELHQQELSATQGRLQQQLLDQQLKQEQASLQQQKQSLEAVHNEQLKGVLDKYRAQMLQVIQDNWHPLVQDASVYCQLLIHVAPGGVITKVDLLSSSGNAALDRSARLAIIKSSPLPVPKDPALFDSFREVRIKMTPQEVKGLS